MFSLDPFGQMGNFSNKCFSEIHMFRSFFLELRLGFNPLQMEHRGNVGSNHPRAHEVCLPLTAHCSQNRLKARVFNSQYRSGREWSFETPHLDTLQIDSESEK